MDLRAEIMKRVAELPVADQEALLEQLRRPRGHVWGDVAPFFGVLDEESARPMRAAIEEECEHVDACDW